MVYAMVRETTIWLIMLWDTLLYSSETTEPISGTAEMIVIIEYNTLFSTAFFNNVNLFDRSVV